MKKIEKLVNKLLEKETGLLVWTGSFLAVMALRTFIEHFMTKMPADSPFEVLTEYLHNVYFFAIAFVLLWLIISWASKKNPKKLAYALLFGLWIIILPPILDMLRTGGAVYWSFYILSSLADLSKYFFSFFGNLPSGIVYFGTRITFILAIILAAVFIFTATKNYLRTVLGAAGVWIAMFFMGVFPTLFFFGYNVFSGIYKFFEIKGFHIIQFFSSARVIFGFDPNLVKYGFAYNLNLIFFLLLIALLLILFFFLDRKKLWAMLKNLRLPQIVYHSGLLFIGIGLGYLSYSENFKLNVFSAAAVLVLLLSVWLAWAASVIANDIYDFEIDKISNPQRPLQQGIFSSKQYAELGIFCFLLSILGGLTIGFPFAVLLLMYQILAWFYSCPPFRLKKFLGAATLASSFASLLVLFLGYILMSSDQTIQNLSWRIILLLAISYTISLPLKDFKDIEGDGKCGIWTLPVIFGEKKARLIAAINVFISFMLSVFLLNELKLFWWAALFGTITFLIINSPKTKPRQLPWRVLIPVSLYGLVLVKIVFIS